MKGLFECDFGVSMTVFFYDGVGSFKKGIRDRFVGFGAKPLLFFQI